MAENLRIKILKVETEEVDDRYRYTRDMGLRFASYPKVLRINVQAIDEGGVKCYFTHSVSFLRSLGYFGEITVFYKEETDFFKRVERLPSVHWNDFRGETYQTENGYNMVKIKAGDSLEVRATVSKRTSQKGNVYKKLTRVKIAGGKKCEMRASKAG